MCTTKGNKDNNNTYYNDPMLPKKTKVKSFSLEDEYCSCGNPTQPSVRNEHRCSKVIKGDVSKLSDRRAYRHENYPEKRKNNRPCSLSVSGSESNGIGTVQGYKGKSSDLTTTCHKTEYISTEELPVENNSKFASPKISSLNPIDGPLGTVRLHKDSEEIKLVQQFLVAYHCTIDFDENDDEHIFETGMKMLSECVKGIPNELPVTSCTTLLSISTMGVKLTNTFGKNMATYPLDTVLYNFTCEENTCYFGLIVHSKQANGSKEIPSSSFSKKGMLYSLLVFMVDTNFAKHSVHFTTALLFGVSCKQVLGGCQQFPYSPAVVLDELNSFYKKRSCTYSLSSYSISDSVNSGKSTHGNSLEKSVPLDTQCGNNVSLSPVTPDKHIIYNTLERIRGNVAYSSTPRDPKKLMISPPTSLVGLNEEEKKELIHEIEKRKKSQSDDKEESSLVDCIHLNNNDVWRRKSTTELELFGNINSCQSKIQVIRSGTNSIGNEYRKPPIYPRHNNPSDMPLIFNGLKSTTHRKSDSSPSFSPKTSLKELFSKTNINMQNRKGSTPPCSSRFYLKQGANENTNVKPFSMLNMASSEHSLDGKTSSTVGMQALSFEKLLADAAGVKYFQEFLKKEFSEENLQFWVACDVFKKLKDVKQMMAMAQKIFNSYLAVDAPFLVNIDSLAVKRVENELDNAHTGMFDVPQQQVFQLMKFDSYNRFLKSSLYQDYIDSEKNCEVGKGTRFLKNQFWTKSMRSPPLASGEKRRNPLNFLSRVKISTSPNHELLRKERSSSLGAYEDCNRKNIVNPSDINSFLPKDQLWNESQSRSKIVRVILPDGNSGFIVGEEGKTLREGLKELGEQKNFQLQNVNVTVGCDKKSANLDSDLTSYQESIVYLEKRVLLRFDLPNGRSVGVKANPEKTLQDVLQPVMKANGFEIENYSILLINTKVPLSLDVCAFAMENKRIVTRANPRKLEKQNSDSAMSRMRSQGFHASFRKYCINSKTTLDGKDDKIESRKVTNKKSDDEAAALMTVLQKSQSSRLDDQRGLISRNIELPDFLKVTSQTPAPIRKNNVNTSDRDLLQSNLSSPQKFPGSPFFIDKSFKDLKDKLDLSTSPPLSTRVHSSLRIIRNWRELPSLHSIDSTTCSTKPASTSGHCISTLPRPTDTKVRLLGLSKSDSSLMIQDNLINMSKSSVETHCSSGSSLKYQCSKEETDTASGNDDIMEDDVFICRNRANTCGPSYREGNDNTKGLVKFRSPSNGFVNRGRPLPIINFNESDILRGLSQSDTQEVTQDEEGGRLNKETKEVTQDSGIDLNPSNSDVNLNSMSTADESSDTSTTSNPMKFSSSLDNLKTESRERIGSVDIVDYDFSPKASERFRRFSLDNDVQSNSVYNLSFEANAVPTPEKGKLLKGETVRGRENEKITFV